jgi:hypothetical protein
VSKNKIKPVSRKADIVVQELHNEILIYDLSIHKAFSLNETSTLVWQACDGSKDISEISAQISRQLKSNVTEDFVWLALEELKRENLLEQEAEVSAPFPGMTRREVIRRVGLASLVALPIISSLVAPTAAHAQSSNCGAAAGRSNGCTCTAAGNCASGCCGNTAGTNTCVAVGLDPVGTICRAGCECASNCCVTNTCASNTGATGSPCTTACQCLSGSCCVGGICALDTVTSGNPCTNTCQCIGASTCSGGLCT